MYDQQVHDTLQTLLPLSPLFLPSDIWACRPADHTAHLQAPTASYLCLIPMGSNKSSMT